MYDPYETVDWEATHHLHSVNHTHTFPPNGGRDDWERSTPEMDGQAAFDSIYASGIRHFAISNYHPAKPTYPLERQFERVPDDALGCPNAEHHAEATPGHYCTIGSYVQSGDGYAAPWQVLFRDALDQLAYDGGGGIVVNHPKRTGLSIDAITSRLDFDARVLGIEAYNHRSEEKPKYGQTGDALDVWDDLLSTGRIVYGFFNPDYHTVWTPAPEWTDRTLGRNVLLVPEVGERAAARAYRRGRFYGALEGSGLAFERVDATPDAVAVETDDAERIDFVADGAVVQGERDRSATYDVDGSETYVRVEASDGDGERIFSQPIVYAPRDDAR